MRKRGTGVTGQNAPTQPAALHASHCMHTLLIHAPGAASDCLSKTKIVELSLAIQFAWVVQNLLTAHATHP